MAGKNKEFAVQSKLDGHEPVLAGPKRITCNPYLQDGIDRKAVFRDIASDLQYWVVLLSLDAE